MNSRKPHDESDMFVLEAWDGHEKIAMHFNDLIASYVRIDKWTRRGLLIDCLHEVDVTARSQSDQVATGIHVFPGFSVHSHPLDRETVGMA